MKKLSLILFTAIVLNVAGPLLYAKPAVAVPAINNIQIRDIGFTSVTIAWLTSEPSQSQISYGTNSVEEFTSPLSSVFASSHSITLSTLRPATQYQFIITANNEVGESVSSQSRTFSTLTFDVDDTDNLGNFARLNDGLTLTPTPTQSIIQQFSNPTNSNLQQSLPGQNYQQPYYPNQAPPQYAQPVYQQAPVYLVPPVIYQQPPQQQILGQTVVVTPTPLPQVLGTVNTNNNDLTTYNSLLIVVLTFISAIMGLLSFQFYKNKQDLAMLKSDLPSQQIQPKQGTKTNPFQRTNTFTKSRKEQRKTYTFDVH